MTATDDDHIKMIWVIHKVLLTIGRCFSANINGAPEKGWAL